MFFFRPILVLGVLVANTCLSGSPDASESLAASPFAGFEMVDMTHSFDENTIYWPTEAPFQHEEEFKGRTDGGWYYTAYRVNTAEHGGTHLDAPIHFAEGRWAADEIPLTSLLTPVVVIDVSAQAEADPDYRLDRAAIDAWESEHGMIPPGTAVLMNAGYAQYWPDRVKYMGTAAQGPEAVAELHFPGFSLAAAQFLYEQRGVVSVGLDTPSIDYGQSKDFVVHRYLYDHNVLGFENVANLDRLPPRGAFIIALPMKIRGGSGGPLRIVALIPAP